MLLNTKRLIFYALLLGGSSIFLSLNTGVGDIGFNPYLALSVGLILILLLLFSKMPIAIIAFIIVFCLALAASYFHSIVGESSGRILMLVSLTTLMLTSDKEVLLKNRDEHLFLAIIYFTIIGYAQYRIYDPSSIKVGDANANFVGIISLLLVFHTFITRMSQRSAGLFLLSLIVSLLGIFTSSSRAAIILTVLTVIVLNFTKLYRLAFGITALFILALFIQSETLNSQFALEQVNHINNRLLLEPLDSDRRFAQVSFLISTVIESPIYLIFPIEDSLVRGILGAGFSDNSVLELSTYVGLLASCIVTGVIFLRILNQFGSLYMFFFASTYILFNTILWTPFIFLFIASGIIYKGLRIQHPRSF